MNDAHTSLRESTPLTPAATRRTARPGAPACTPQGLTTITTPKENAV